MFRITVLTHRSAEGLVPYDSGGHAGPHPTSGLAWKPAPTNKKGGTSPAPVKLVVN